MINDFMIAGGIAFAAFTAFQLDEKGIVDLGIHGTPFYRICKTKIVENLKSPSSYIEASSMEQTKQFRNVDLYRIGLLIRELQKAQQNAFLPLHDSNFNIDSLKQNEQKYATKQMMLPFQHEVKIRFESRNGFGALVQGTGRCEYITENEEDINLDDANIFWSID